MKEVEEEFGPSSKSHSDKLTEKNL